MVRYFTNAVVAATFITNIVAAQTGIIEGVVLESGTKSPVVGASVIVVGTTLGSATDDNGRFTIKNIPVGMHAVRISSIGYAPFIETDIMVSAVKPVTLTVYLVEQPLEYNGIQVTETYFQKLPEQTVSSIIQTNEEIRRLPGGLEDVVRALSIAPGVAQVQAGRNDLIIRGGAPSENLFLIDNIEVPNINHFGTQGASGGPLSFINIDYIDRTTFSTGGFSVEYGDKLSSVLSIALKDGRTDRTGLKGTLSASQFGFNVEGPLSTNGNYFFTARRSYLDFIFKAAGFGFVPEYWDFLGRTKFKISSTDNISILAIGVLDRVRYFNDTPEKRFSNSRILGSNQNQFIGGVTWNHIGENQFTSVTLSENYVEYEYKQSDTLLNPIFQNYSYEHEGTLKLTTTRKITRATELLIGASVKSAQSSANIFVRPQVTSFGDSIAFQNIYKTGATKAAAFVQLIQTFNKFKVNIGSRVDYFDLITKKFAFSPRLAVTYSVSPELNINASVGRYYQAPSYIWLVANPFNKNLKFIGLTQYILGGEYFFDSDVKFTLEVYRKQYINYPTSITRPYLVFANTGAGFGGTEEGFASFGFDPLVSKGEGTARGIELFVQKKLSESPYYGTVSFSYSKTDFKALDRISRPSSFDQRLIVNLGGGYMLGKEWEFSAKFRYATGRPYTPFSNNNMKIPALYNTARTASNHSLDVRVDRFWMFERWNLVVFLDIQNIYNRKPVDIPRFNTRTNSYEQTSSIGILPSIGVSIEY
ncbi:MAG: TonB-dependent receptor [Bacteroidetes bacterium]|nr:TonB-dependent receptor [Bacteroidota bacterium]